MRTPGQAINEASVLEQRVDPSGVTVYNTLSQKKKTIHLTFDNDFGKYRPIFNILLLTHS